MDKNGMATKPIVFIYFLRFLFKARFYKIG